MVVILLFRVTMHTFLPSWGLMLSYNKTNIISLPSESLQGMAGYNIVGLVLGKHQET